MTRRTRILEPQLTRVRALMSERVGYLLPDDFRAFIARQTLRLATEQAEGSVEDLLARLDEEASDSRLWTRFISLMTISESYLFRNPNHVRMLERALLPRLVEVAERRPVRIWSAGCAMGQEPYTLAILLHEIEPRVAELPLRIVATDIDAESLAGARVARYGAWAFRRTPFFIQRKYFTKHEDQLVLSSSVTQMVEFSHHHVALDRDLPGFPMEGFDLILCRNLLMYLRSDFQVRAARMLARRLHPEGILLAGQVERLSGVEEQLRHRFVSGSLVYFHEDRTLQILAGAGFDIRKPRHRLEDELEIPTDTPWPSPRPESSQDTLDPDSREALKLRGMNPRQADLHEARKRLQDILERTQETLPSEEEEDGEEPSEELPRPRLGGSRETPLSDRSASPSSLTVEALYDTVRSLMFSGDTVEASRYSEALLEADPLQPAHHCLSALVKLEADDAAGAVEALRRAVYCDPDNLTAYYLWWLTGLRYRGLGWEKTRWARRHLQRLTHEMPADERVPLIEGVTVGDIRYLLQRSWDSFER